MRTAYAPSLRVRLVWWFGIYLASYLWLLWCAPGEFHDWTSILKIPQGLITAWLYHTHTWWPVSDAEISGCLRVVYGLYLTLFALCLAVRSRRSFRVLIVIFVFVSCISSYGIGWREG